jgi:phosphate:Na+ symporter
VAAIETLTTTVQAAGGLGLFLVGMIVMTDGLKALAGDAVRGVLMRFTRSPVSGAMTGAATTALLQSSSATTVATVGFVGAGLIAFPNALGIIFGANVGTTITGWLVALLGFNLKLGEVVMPVILIGAILRLFGKGRSATIGYAAAGFGIIFVGISTMQVAMSGFEGIITPDSLPRDSIAGRLAIVALGMLATIVTQSSSAGVAAAITALYAGAISFEQAAALVIGMDIGTTVTAAIATIGGTVDAKRTGVSHVVYNFLTAAGALLLITPYTWVWDRVAPGQIELQGEIALVAFHTTFNGIGVLMALPFTARFARLIVRLVPDQQGALGLEPALLEQPGLALDAAQKALARTYSLLLTRMRTLLTTSDVDLAENLAELEAMLDDTSAYLDRIHVRSSVGPDWDRLMALMHALDHAQRLLDRCDDDFDRIATVRDTPELQSARDLLLEGITAAEHAFDTHQWSAASKKTANAGTAIEGMASPFRDATVAAMARGDVEGPKGAEMMHALRWARRVSKHVASIAKYLERAYQAAGKESAN